jgi:cytochrome c-type biogenesis protein CcmH
MHLYFFWIVAALLTALTVFFLLRPIADKRSALALTCLVPCSALALYAWLGRPDLTQWRTQPQLPPFIAASVDHLIQDTRDHPTDVQAWILLGDVYAKIRRYGDAATAYRQAALLDPSTPVYNAMVGQALVMQDGGAVGQDALMWFAKARQDPTARYYQALAKSQAGDWKGALAEWEKLAQENPEGMGDAIAARIADAHAALGMDRH